jgi:hypothetical protein
MDNTPSVQEAKEIRWWEVPPDPAGRLLFDLEELLNGRN